MTLTFNVTLINIINISQISDEENIEDFLEKNYRWFSAKLSKWPKLNLLSIDGFEGNKKSTWPVFTRDSSVDKYSLCLYQKIQWEYNAHATIVNYV